MRSSRRNSEPSHALGGSDLDATVKAEECVDTGQTAAKRIGWAHAGMALSSEQADLVLPAGSGVVLRGTHQISVPRETTAARGARLPAHIFPHRSDRANRGIVGNSVCANLHFLIELMGILFCRDDTAH